MIINTDFSLAEKVIIHNINDDWKPMAGRVVEICVAEKGLMYQIRYFQEGVLIENFFYADELRKDE